MAYLTPTMLRRPAGLGAFGVLDRMFDSLAADRKKRETREILMRLTDRELDDIGLTRADVENSDFRRRG